MSNLVSQLKLQLETNKESLQQTWDGLHFWDDVGPTIEEYEKLLEMQLRKYRTMSIVNNEHNIEILDKIQRNYIIKGTKIKFDLTEEELNNLTPTPWGRKKFLESLGIY